MKTYHSNALRIQALALLSYGIPYNKVSKIINIPRRTLEALKKKARDHGYNPQEDPHIKEEYVTDTKQSGRPKEITEEIEQSILESVRKD